MLIEATRRVSKAAVNRIREAFLEYDRVVFKDVDIPPETAYTVIRDGRTWVLAFEDPSVGAVFLPECKPVHEGDWLEAEEPYTSEQLRECGS